MEALYTAEQLQRVEVTNGGDAVAFLAERDLERYGRDNPFVALSVDEAGKPVLDEAGEQLTETLGEVVYDGAATVAPGQTVEWVLGEGATLYGDGDLAVAEHAGRGRLEGEKPEEGLGRE